MIVILASIFAFLLISMTAFSLMKVYTIAYKRREISLRKLFFYSTATVIICFAIAFLTPFFYQYLIDKVFQI